MIYSDFDLDIAALTVWAEARGESIEGQKAVIHVIRNRWQNPGWWSRQAGDGIEDDTLAAVCRDRYQFSCWNPSDPQSKRLHNPETLKRPDVQRIRQLVETTLREPDFTGGADHYCTKKVAPYTRWAKGRKPVKVVGSHQFYKIGLG
jgi:spore germination cell wall hydrolase CwlJ-like protein